MQLPRESTGSWGSGFGVAAGAFGRWVDLLHGWGRRWPAARRGGRQHRLRGGGARIADSRPAVAASTRRLAARAVARVRRAAVHDPAPLRIEAGPLPGGALALGPGDPEARGRSGRGEPRGSRGDGREESSTSCSTSSWRNGAGWRSRCARHSARGSPRASRSRSTAGCSSSISRSPIRRSARAKYDLGLLLITVEGILHHHILSTAHYKKLFGGDLTDPRIRERTKRHLQTVILALVESGR